MPHSTDGAMLEETIPLPGSAAKVRAAQFHQASGSNEDFGWEKHSIRNTGVTAGEVRAFMQEAEPKPVRPSWPAPLATKAFHGVAGEVIRVIAPESEADPAALLIQLLVAVGSLIGRGPHFIVEQCVHSLNLFTVVVGRTAKSRKGTSWAWIRALLLTMDPVWVDARIHGGVGSGEGIIWAVRDPILKGDKLIEEGVEDKRLLLLETEFAQVLAVIQRRGDTTSEVLRRGWDGTTTLQTLTKNSPARATGAHIAMIGHITEEELRRHLTATEMANGLANRIIFCCSRRSNVLPDGGTLNWNDSPNITEKLREVVLFARDVGEMTRDSEARTLWHKVYPALSEGKLGMFGSVVSRGEAQVLRLSMVYALLDCSAVIRRAHLEAALEVWRYAEDSCRYIFGDSLGDPVADEILRAMRNGPNGLTRTEIAGLFSRNSSSAQIEAALGVLREHNLAHFEKEDTGGRAAERWFASINKYEIDQRKDETPQAE